MGAAPPEAPAQPRLPPRQDEEADPVLPVAKMASQNGAPSSFFLFLRYEVEIPRRRGVEIPPRIRLSLPQVMAPPQLRGDPCEANLPGPFPDQNGGVAVHKRTFGAFSRQLRQAGLRSIFAAIHPEFQVRRESFTRLAGGGNGRRKPAHNVGADTWPRPAPLGG